MCITYVINTNKKQPPWVLKSNDVMIKINLKFKFNEVQIVFIKGLLIENNFLTQILLSWGLRLSDCNRNKALPDATLILNLSKTPYIIFMNLKLAFLLVTIFS